jgi:cellobiose-specific phosphotransferase system component IIC
MPAKKYVYDKLVLALLSALIFLTIAIIVNILLRVGSGQGISDYYIEYRQGPHHSPQGDFSPTGSIWAMLNFIWFSLVVAITSAVMSVRAYKIKREISVVVLSLGTLLVFLALIVSNVLLGHR